MDQQEFDALIEREKTYLTDNLRRLGFQEKPSKIAAERFFSLKAVSKSSYQKEFGFALRFVDEQFEYSGIMVC